MNPVRNLVKEKIVRFLRWSERYTETDMLYAVKGGFWIILGKIGIFTVVFAKMIAFGRYASQEFYGTYAFIISMAMIFTIFSLPGINTSLIKAIARRKEKTFILAVKEKLKFSLIGSLISLTVACWYFYNQNNLLAIAFLTVAVFLPFQSSFPVFSSFWIGRKNFKRNTEYEFASIFLVALVVVPVIIFTNNPVLVVIALFGSQSLFNGILLAKTVRQRQNEETMPESISYGKNLTVMIAAASFAEQADKVILWKFFGPIPLAIYSFARLPIQYMQEIVPISFLALPKIGEKSVKEMKEGLMKKFKKLFFVFALLTFLIIVIAPYFYKIVLPQYIESAHYFQGLSLALFLSPFLLLSAALVSEMKKKELYLVQIITPALRIVLFLILIPLYQIWGVIFSILISQSLNGLLVLYFFRKI